MSITWKYKIELRDSSVWAAIEKKAKTQIPQELKDFIEAHNAASPKKDSILINGTERIFDAVLSFNEKEVDASTFGSAYKAINDAKKIPFAKDPFGNYFCYSLKSKKIEFYNHETQKFEKTEYSLTTLIDSLA